MGSGSRGYDGVSAEQSQMKYLIVFQDLFTRWVELKPIRKADRKSVARALEELILFR